MPQVSKWVQTLNKAQQRSLKRVFDRGPVYSNEDMKRLPNSYQQYCTRLTYRQFRKKVQFSFDCAMVPWCGMWLGIEQDGYTHS